MAASSDPLAIGLAIVALRGRWHLLTSPVVARPPTRPTCAMAMTMHVTHDQHVVKAATLAHDELSRSQVMHWHAYGPLWWPVVALMNVEPPSALGAMLGAPSMVGMDHVPA